jgi:hypothetical protein
MRKYLAGFALALLASLGVADAQQIAIPTVQTVGTSDLFLDVAGGIPGVPNQYATAAQISGPIGYSYQIPLTGFTITAANSTALLYLNPAGTLATGTLTLAANPSDGQNFCLLDTKTQTAITVNANTGQTLAGLAAPTALVAGQKYCWFFNKPLGQWIQYQ